MRNCKQIQSTSVQGDDPCICDFNKDNFLSLDFGLKEFGEMDDSERFRRYRRFLYEAAAIDKGKGATIGKKIVGVERKKDFNLTRTRRFLYRTRYSPIRESSEQRILSGLPITV